MKMLSMKVNLNNILIIRSGNMYVAVCDAFRHVYIYRDIDQYCYIDTDSRHLHLDMSCHDDTYHYHHTHQCLK